jgi:hypothetical protein
VRIDRAGSASEKGRGFLDISWTNGAMTSLNLSSNSLEAEGAKIIAEALLVTNYVIAVILAPFHVDLTIG